MDIHREYERLLSDNRLLPSERDLCIVKVLGSVRRPATIGEAKRVMAEVKLSLDLRTSEIPL